LALAQLALAQGSVALADARMHRQALMPRLLLAAVLGAFLAGCGTLPRVPVPQYEFPIVGGGGANNR
jgi:hypothetical protein